VIARSISADFGAMHVWISLQEFVLGLSRHWGPRCLAIRF
jgi:hypothetical protein